MSTLHTRQIEILKAIINRYIENAEPVSSKSLDFDVSSATIRNDMMTLEDEGLIVKPHTSAGRIPTVKGYRLFVNNFIEEQKLVVKSGEDKIILDEEHIYKAISNISDQTDAIAFAVMDSDLTYYLGVSKLIMQPEFQSQIEKTVQLINLLETKQKFAEIIHHLDIEQSQIRIFVGIDRILPVSLDCSMMAVRFQTKNISGTIGILGSLRMDYLNNAEILKNETELLQGYHPSAMPILLDPGKKVV